MTDNSLEALQGVLQYRFRDPGLLELALLHESHANEQGLPESNERLEFLGDAVLELVVSNYLFNRHTHLSEGMLTQLRAHLVSTRNLANRAAHFGLRSYVRLGRGEESSGGRERQNLQADLLEALVGAVFLDGGLEAASQLVLHFLGEDKDDDSFSRDYKSLLQELTARYRRAAPQYLLADSSGPPHRPLFRVQVEFEGRIVGEGTGPSKREAAQEAARVAMSLLETELEPPDGVTGSGQRSGALLPGEGDPALEDLGDCGGEPGSSPCSTDGTPG
ncbi:ribonuclease III [bacterium CPR1]|nr:ribonuclease III [bacterium CPR1]